MPGLFVVLEGLDRAGKSTQASMLQQHWLAQGVKVKLYTFPNRSTESGQKIHAHLAGSSTVSVDELHQLFADNRREAAPLIKQDLAEGTHVIADRYLFSGVAYAMVRGLPIDGALALEKGLPLPDVVMFLSCSITNTRDGYGQERYEQDTFQREVKEAFTQVQQRFPSLWHNINANESVDQVHRSVVDVVMQLVPGTLRYC